MEPNLMAILIVLGVLLLAILLLWNVSRKLHERLEKAERLDHEVDAFWNQVELAFGEMKGSLHDFFQQDYDLFGTEPDSRNKIKRLISWVQVRALEGPNRVDAEQALAAIHRLAYSDFPGLVSAFPELYEKSKTGEMHINVRNHLYRIDQYDTDYCITVDELNMSVHEYNDARKRFPASLAGSLFRLPAKLTVRRRWPA